MRPAPGRSGTYQETEARKGHHEDNEFPHLDLVAQARRLMPGAFISGSL